ncbi:hypothetical protein ATANTOWER_011333, partial [Ataeniobius toweri]|nr:hypothetical protein [Ataeniobius toweri]
AVADDRSADQDCKVFTSTASCLKRCQLWSSRSVNSWKLVWPLKMKDKQSV